MTTNQKSLVFVVGAGASAEIGLPIGAGLKDKIASELEFGKNDMGDPIPGNSMSSKTIFEFARTNSRRAHHYYDACQHIRSSMPLATSIDNFINDHRDKKEIAFCGKIAIANIIINEEKASKIYVDRNNFFNRIYLEDPDIKKTWYFNLFSLLSGSLEEMPQKLSKIAFVIFNYDRCVEHFLHQSLMVYFGIDSEKATELLSHLQIYHPYGSVGRLEWERREGEVCCFGQDPQIGDKLRKIADGIKTFTEGTDESHSDIVAIRETMELAERIVFLGFSFNDQNLDLLFGDGVASPKSGQTSVYATALGISSTNTEIIKEKLSSLTNDYRDDASLERIRCPRVNIDRISCSTLLSEFSLSLKIYC